jgi:hypothetical protein
MTGTRNQDVCLSAPERPRHAPRELSDTELRGLLAIADVLIPHSGEMPSASQAPDYERWLLRALASRPDAFDALVAEGERRADTPADALAAEVRQTADSDPDLFGPLSVVLAGAYLMIPEIRKAIGYPGQERRPAPFDQAASEIMDGILDPVIERGSIYTPAGD